MKASERSKNKFKAIQDNLEMISFYKNQIRFFYPLRNQKGALARWDLKRAIKKLHRALFVLRAMEKQIKMPVKVVVVEAGMYKHGTIFGLFIPAVFVIKREYQCPRCGKVLRKDPMSYVEKRQKPNYCHCCGQNLWWR